MRCLDIMLVVKSFENLSEAIVQIWDHFGGNVADTQMGDLFVHTMHTIKINLEKWTESQSHPQNIC